GSRIHLPHLSLDVFPGELPSSRPNGGKGPRACARSRTCGRSGFVLRRRPFRSSSRAPVRASCRRGGERRRFPTLRTERQGGGADQRAVHMRGGHRLDEGGG